MTETKPDYNIRLTGFNEKLVNTPEGRDAILNILIPAIHNDRIANFKEQKLKGGGWECLGSYLGMVYSYVIEYSITEDADIVSSIHRLGTLEEYEEQQLRMEVTHEVELQNLGWGEF